MKNGVWAAGLLVLALVLIVSSNASGDEKKAKKDFTKPADDQTFILMAASGGKLEVELGKIMTEKAKHDEVKKYAEKMVKDHTKANQELKTVAQNLSIQLPEMMDAKHRKTLEHFQNAGAADLDREYMRHMVADHVEAVALFRHASQEAKHPEVKQFAAKTLPHLEEHLSLAKKVRSQLDGKGGKGGGKASDGDK